MDDTYNDDSYDKTQEKDYPSRKRPFSDDEDKTSDGASNRSRESKRMHVSQSSPLLKVLIPNYAAGAIIGKGGTNIGELQNRYGAKIRLSPSREFYPGTEERIVIITGEVTQIVDMNNYIIDKVLMDSSDANHHFRGRPEDSERGQKIKIVVPNSTAGLLIGRGGSAIKSLQEDTKAKIVISGRDEATVPGERIITISGNTEQRIEAARQVVNKIAADAENMANKNLTYSGGVSSRNGGGGGGHSGGGHTGGGHGGGGHGGGGIQSYGNMEFNHRQGGGGGGGGLPNNLTALSSMIGNLQHQTQTNNQNLLASLSQNPLSALNQSALAGQLGLGGNVPAGLGNLGNLGGGGAVPQVPNLGFGQNIGSVVSSIKTTVTIQMEIPDILVGAILGKQGKTVHEFIQFSGAKIQFSGKNDFAPGTTDRILTIQGDLNQTQIAYFLINQKITQAENELASGLLRR